MYEDFWGLQVSPFKLTADSRFFYPTPAYLQALSTIRSAIYAHKGLIHPSFFVPQWWMERTLVASFALLAVGLFLVTQNFQALLPHS